MRAKMHNMVKTNFELATCVFPIVHRLVCPPKFWKTIVE